MGAGGASDGDGRPWLSFIYKEHVQIYLDIEETFNNVPPPK